MVLDRARPDLARHFEEVRAPPPPPDRFRGDPGQRPGGGHRGTGRLPGDDLHGGDRHRDLPPPDLHRGGGLTDFGPLLANPKTAFLGAAAQIGIFATLLGALALSDSMWAGSISRSRRPPPSGSSEARTARRRSSSRPSSPPNSSARSRSPPTRTWRWSPPPASDHAGPDDPKEERAIEMRQLREVCPAGEKIALSPPGDHPLPPPPPGGRPLVGRPHVRQPPREAGVVDRLSRTAQNELINLVTILLGLAVGSRLEASLFLRPRRSGSSFWGPSPSPWAPVGGCSWPSS
jgi:hypothetical protein